jgi:hypothetical protein
MGNTIRAVLIAAFLLLAGTACFSKPEAGEIGVQRGGGPVEGKAFKDILCPGQGTKTVWNDSVHYYPHSGVQRYFTIGQGEGDLKVPVRVQTSDGFFVTLRGTLYFNTTFDCTDDGRARVREFDSAYGVRKFAEPGGSDAGGKYPYEGDRGWIAFLDTVARPVIVNELAQTMQGFRCRELISSCALVTGDGTSAEVGTTRIDYEAIQQAVATGMQTEMEDTLGDEYLTGWRFVMQQPMLEREVQDAINRSQAAYANVSVQRAAKDAAEQQRQAAEKLAAVYESSPALAQIEMLRILCGTNAALAQTQRNAQDTSGCNGANVYLGVDPVVTIPAGARAGTRP